MAEAVRMPKMSDTMTEGVIVAWHKKVGDKVKAGDVLAEIETDKAVMEFESYQEGTLLYIGADKGATIKVNDVIAVLGKEGEDYKAALNGDGTAQKEEKKSSPASKEKKKEEQQEEVKKEESKEEEQQEEVEEEDPAAKKEAPKKEAATEKKVEQPSVADSRIKASPLAKKIASDSKIPIEKIKGSGTEGRIVRRDVENYIKEKPTAPSRMVTQVEGEESYDEIAVSQMRKTIARRLTESKFSAPEFYLTMQINMDRCADFRTQINELNPEEKISFNDIIIKAVALALRKNLKVNSSWLGDKIRYNHHIHIGMAVAVEDGLLVPVIKFADQKTFSQINTEAKMFAAKAREKKLQPEEMSGNTFTISNLGMMDIDEFTAIINPPDSCILAIGKINKQPALVNDRVKVANIMKVTMTCDHRAVDGATGAQFLQTLKSILENPLSMLY